METRFRRGFVEVLRSVRCSKKKSRKMLNILSLNLHFAFITLEYLTVCDFLKYFLTKKILSQIYYTTLCLKD